MPAFLNASQEPSVPSYQLKYQQLLQKSDMMLKANKEKRAAAWKGISMLENNVRNAFGFADKCPRNLVNCYMTWLLRCSIDRDFLTEEQQMNATNAVPTLMGPIIEQDESDKIIADIKKELKELIEQDQCGGVEWRDKYGATPEHMMTPPTPKTLRASRLKALENFN